jgi:type VI secretion system protein ImpA
MVVFRGTGLAVSLSSFGDDAPSGKNLEYDAVFTDLLLAAQPAEERQVGQQITPQQEPDPAAIIHRATAVLERSHDLRAAVLLGYAELRVNGLPGLATATGCIRVYLQDFWDTCHPQLDADDDDDPTMRVNAVLGLCDPDTVLRAVRLAPLTRSTNIGRFSLRDVAIADGEMDAPPNMENVPDRTTVAAAFKDTPADVLAEILTGARAALRDVEGINAVFDEKLPGQGPELDPLVKLLRRAVGRMASEIGEPEVPGSDEGQEEVSGQSVSETRASPTPGEITSSRDVEVTLDRLMAYYTKYEPSSPVPILLARAKRLIGADFMTIVKEIAPGGADNVKLIGGLE